MSEARVYKMGVDVGGTFTHAVVLATPGPELLASVRVPTSHRHANGVAQGVIEAALEALRESGVTPEGIRLIAHSTTQATNALLEGDVAMVGVLGMGGGVLGQKVKADTAIGDVPLGKGHTVKTCHAFINEDEPDETALREALSALQAQGAKAIVSAQAYAVDNPEAEERAVELALSMGLPATATHHVSSLYGLKARLRTAVINAGILPVMTATAELTQKALRDSGLKAPLMVVRSDGGMMTLEEMRRRPILTLLSGPAAGVAAAVKFSRLSQAVFLEVGGTSTDMCVILGGRARLRTAMVGGHRLHLKTVDVVTEGLAGGSLFRLENGKPVEAGPRSAHIAGLLYSAFSPVAPPVSPVPQADQHHAGLEYLAAKDAAGTALTLTPTCTAVGLGRLDLPGASRENVLAVAGALGSDPESFLKSLDALVVNKAKGFVEALLKEHELGAVKLVLAGGGGGAYAFTGEVAKAMGMAHELVPHAEVISAIGAALAAVKETVERNSVNPSDEELMQIRDEALKGAIRMGARADTVTVQVSVDSTRNLIRAEATGSTDATQDTTALDPGALLDHVRPLINFEPQNLDTVFENSAYLVLKAAREDKKFLGLGKSRREQALVVEKSGIVLLAVEHPSLVHTTAGELEEHLSAALGEKSRYGDAGQTLPPAWIVGGARMVDLSALSGVSAALKLAALELGALPAAEPCLIVLGKAMA